MAMTLEEALARINTLEGQLTEVRNEAAEKRTKNRELKADNDKLKGDVTTLTKERDDAVGKVGKPSELQTKVDDLTGQLRSIKHQDAFKRLAAEAKVKPKAVGPLWDALKLKADTDEPDEKAMKAALDGAKETHDFAFDLVEGDESQEDKPPPRPALGGDRGGTPPGKFVLTPEQRRDPKFMVENDALIRQHEKAGTLVRK